MRLMATPREQLAIVTEHAVDVQVEAELLEKLERSAKTGKPLRVKAGFDPTSPDIHLGHTVVLRQMRRFQDLGHIAVLVVGDFTARIGDPTGKSTTRPKLSAEEIAHNAATYQHQAFKVLDPSRTEVRFNSEWLATLGSVGLIELAASYPLARMMEREDFKTRWETGRSIALHELLYPLLQAQDSVALEADIELGGTDQLFNLLVGRHLMRERGLAPQIVMTSPILEGLDAKLEGGKIVGEKMSKSVGNYVGVNEPAKEIFGKLMSITDDLMWRYYELLSSLPASEIAALRVKVQMGEVHPKAAKQQLGLEIAGRFAGESEAAAALAEFERVFAKGALPDTIEEKALAGPTTLLKALVDTGLVSSNGEGRRLIAQGGVTLDGNRQEDGNAALPAGKHLVKLGKRRFCYLVVG
jgi:tyrosyl-tRNA synthetase